MKKKDFFGDYGPLRTIPRDVVDKIIENLSIKDLKNLTLVNRFLNDAVENIDEEANPSRIMDFYKTKSQGGHYFKSLDPINIENVKNDFKNEYLRLGEKIPKNRYYYEEIYSDNDGSIRTFQYIINPDSFQIEKDKKGNYTYFSLAYNYKKIHFYLQPYINTINSWRTYEDLKFCTDDQNSIKNKLNKLKYFLENRSDSEYSFSLTFLHPLFHNDQNDQKETRKYGFKKLTFL